MMSTRYMFLNQGKDHSFKKCQVDNNILQGQVDYAKDKCWREISMFGKLVAINERQPEKS